MLKFAIIGAGAGGQSMAAILTSKGYTAKLYDGMTAEITFITKETKDVTYVSNRAVYRENGKSYVRMRDENGNVISVKVVTGFSDGSYVEIVEGLSEGDTVLIESGVSDS